MILVFAKTPVPGKVKTRLISFLGKEAATGLYRELMYRTLETACSNGQLPVQLQLLGAEDHPDILDLISKFPVKVQQQCGHDLGERMYLAAESMGEKSMVILIGTDCPMLSREYILAAIAALKAGNDVVVGPAEDGGYVLLGLRRNHADLFSGIDWGTEKVLAQTITQIKQLGWHYQLLPTLWDVDRPADVQRFEQMKIRPE